MHRLFQLIVYLVLFPALSIFAAGFDEHFENATLRVDFYQYGDADSEYVTVDRLIKQGQWAGPIGRLLDPHPYGGYIARAIDPASGETIFQLGFDSLFGEYRTTGPAARGEARVYHETILLPYPKKTIRFTVSRASTDDEETVLFEMEIDPRSVAIAVEPPREGVRVVNAHIAGDPHSTLDIAIIGEGYTEDQIKLFRADVTRFADLILSQEPYFSRSDSISIRGVMLPSLAEGCDEPTRGIWRSTALSAGFNALGSPRYLLTESNRDLRDIAANAPYDTLVIMVNHERYGGGGIYNRYCTFTAHGEFSPYLLLHEFGHSFGGLADEYYTSSTAYNDFYPEGTEPVSPNISAATDREEIKWAALVTADAPIPTPWDKADFDSADLAYQVERREIDGAIAEATRTESFQFELDALHEAARSHAAERVAAVDSFMDSSGSLGTVGAFEGAGYVSEGLYRPSIDCLMFTRGVKALCPVCRRAVASRIDFYTGR